MVIQHIIIGSIAIALGIISLKYNYQVVGITGNVGFAEKYLGPGNTYLFFKLLSILMIIGGMLYMFGFWDAVIGWLLSPLLRLFPGLEQIS